MDDDRTGQTAVIFLSHRTALDDAGYAAAIAWRDQRDHAAIRAQGRARWYDRYEIAVATVERSYACPKP